MLPDFLLEDTIVRESGESPVFDCGPVPVRDLALTLGITHALEQQSLEVEIHQSEDGQRWEPKPVLTFTPKYYCGTYEMCLARPTRYLRVRWRVERWARSGSGPFFRIYVLAQQAVARYRLAGAA